MVALENIIFKKVPTLKIKYYFFAVNDKSANFDVKDVAKDFSSYFLNLAKYLVSKLQNPSNKYFVPSVAQYYSHLGLTKNMIYYQQENIMYLRLLEILTPQKLLVLQAPWRIFKRWCNALLNWLQIFEIFQYL